MIFEDLRAFIAVARNESFARASVNLCVAQSALSKRVHRLESQLGQALLDRHARGVSLTEVGQAFFAQAQRLVEGVEELERNLSSFVQVPTGRVNVALPIRTSGLLSPPLIQRCLEELPLVDVQILEGTPANVHGWLMRGEADLAISYNSELGSGFDIVPLFSEPLFLCAAPKLLEEYYGANIPKSCCLQDLAGLPLVMTRKPDILRLTIDRLSAGHGIRPNIIYESNALNTIYGLAKLGVGASVVSLSTSWVRSVESGTIVGIPFSSPLMSWKAYLVRAEKGSDVLATNRVSTILSQEMDKLLAKGLWPNATTFRDIGHSTLGAQTAEE